MSGLQPSTVTCNVLIDGWCKTKNLVYALRTYRLLRAHKLEPNVVTFTVLTKGMAEVGMLQEAAIVFFQMMKRGHMPDVVAYCSLIDCLCKHGNLISRLKVYDIC